MAVRAVGCAVVVAAGLSGSFIAGPARAADSAATEWLGALTSSFGREIPFRALIDARSTPWQGRYDDLGGAVADVQGTLSGNGTLDFTITSANADCAVALNGNGTLSANVLQFSVGGTRCGSRFAGNGVALMQTGRSVAYGQAAPRALVADSTHLYWLADGDAALVKAPKAGGPAAALAWAMGVPDALRRLGDGSLLWSEASTGISDWGCTGPGARRSLMRASADGTQRWRLDAAGGCANGRPTLAVSGAHAYWVGSKASPDQWFVRKVPLGGGKARNLVQSTTMIDQLAADTSNLYWIERPSTEPGRLRRIPLAGGSAVDLVPASAGLVFDGPMLRVGSRLYFVVWRPANGYAILRVGVNGGAPQTVVEIAPPALGELAQRPLQLASDGTRLLWITERAVRAVPLAGGAVSELANGFEFAHAIEAAGDRVFVATDRAVFALPADGGPPGRLCSGARAPTALRADGGALLVADGSVPERFGQIRSVALDACRATTVAGGIGDGRLLALRDGQLYVADGWRIRKLPVGGGQPRVIARAGFHIDGLAVDGAGVYYAFGPATTVMATGLDGGAARVLASGMGPAGALRTRGGRVYFLDHFDTIGSVARQGGPVTTHVRGSFISDFVVDDQALTWADGAAIVRRTLNGDSTRQIATGMAGSWITLLRSGADLLWFQQLQILKVPASGGAASFVADGLYTDAVAPGALAADSAQVYWTETGVAAVKRIAR